MDIKKRPPPGATLISRLREGRLKREQALAEKRGQQLESTEAAPAQAETVVEAEPIVEVKPAARDESKVAGGEDAAVTKKSAARSRASKKEAAGGESFGEASTVQVTVEVAAVEVSSKAPSLRSEKAELVDVEVEDFSPQPKSTALKTTPQPADLLRRSISIEDLRPFTDDYEVLTEEIRLAGRFAAAGLIAQGLRLSRLKDDSIYKNHYSSFEEYCRKEHDMSATYAYRLIRMSEMAERLGEEGTHAIGAQYAESMPDPFEVMLGLGHRHLLALLPLETEAAQDLLVRGVPVADESGKVGDRIPISRATEQQIRQALKLLLPAAAPQKVKKKPSAVPTTHSVRTLRDMVEMLIEWADWLDSQPDPRILEERVGHGRDKSRLAQRMRTAVDRILELL